MKRLVLLSAIVLSGCTPPLPPQTAAACRAPLKPATSIELYLGRDRGAAGDVTNAQWASFLNEEVTPRFPSGLSVIDVAGQYREKTGKITRERTKLLIVVVFDAPAHEPKIEAVVAAYNARFHPEGVFRVERPVCAGAG